MIKAGQFILITSIGHESQGQVGLVVAVGPDEIQVYIPGHDLVGFQKGHGYVYLQKAPITTFEEFQSVRTAAEHLR